MMKPKSTKLDYEALNRMFTAHQRAYFNKLHIHLDDETKLEENEKIMLENEKRIIKFFKQQEMTTEKNLAKKKSEQQKGVVVKDGSRKRLYLMADKGKKPVGHTSGAQGDLWEACQYLESELNREEESSLASNPSPSPESSNHQGDQAEACSRRESGSPLAEETAKQVQHDYHKISFLRNVGLIPREEYERLKKGADSNTKQTRSKRTTANPQFSRAAIEAKLVTRHEISKERKQRQLAREKEKKKASQLPKNANNSEKLDSSRVKLIKIFENENNRFYKESSLVWIGKGTNFKEHCKLCGETCSTSSDSVLACKDCFCFFHANCLVQKRDLIAGNINCPNCTGDSSYYYDNEKTKELHRLIMLKKCISGLHISTQFLQATIKDTESKINITTKETEILENNVNRIRDIFKLYDINDEVTETDKRQTPNNSQENCNRESVFGSYQNGSLSTSSNQIEHSSLHYKYNAPDASIVQKGFAQDANCDQDFPMVFCA